ncbi:MAG: hypothetical protein IJZ74_05335 [Clostridia bacterium]|nr:hypothetical protein [Clostridia bacterium]
MKSRNAALLISLCLLAYMGLCAYIQWRWDAECLYATARATQVYTPGTADDIAITLPAGTPCRAEETVGDSWQAIEYMVSGETRMGMVRAGSLVKNQP